MSAVLFYEKPGCITNARQKKLLRQYGVELQVRDLLMEPWTEAGLYAFLKALPVAQWFNPAAPRIKSGEIKPEALDAQTAIALLLDDHLLIRRPLLESTFGKTAGFDNLKLLTSLGIPVDALGADTNSCSKPDANHGCAEPE